MKSPQIATALSIAFILGVGLEKSSAISSPILLTINDSNPAAVTITATGFAAAVNDGTKPASSGVDLLGFFSSNVPGLFGQLLLGSNLSGGNSGVSYNDVRGDNFSTSGGNSVDFRLSLDISSPGSGNTQTFSTSQPAFTGTWTIDLSALGINGSALPSPGTTGDILSGFSGDTGAIIGQWEIAPVPEPGMGGLLVLGSIIGTIIRRRKQK